MHGESTRPDLRAIHGKAMDSRDERIPRVTLRTNRPGLPRPADKTAQCC